MSDQPPEEEIVAPTHWADGLRITRGSYIAPNATPYLMADRIRVSREDVEDQPNLRAMIHDAMERAEAAQYAAPGLVLHPYDWEEVYWSGKPWTPEKIAAMTALADVSGRAYWTLGIPGYPVPRRVRVRRRIARVRRWLLDAPTRLPLVEKHWDDDWGYTPHVERYGRWWVKVGRYDVGRRPEEDW